MQGLFQKQFLGSDANNQQHASLQKLQQHWKM